MKPPAFQFYADDFLAGTLGMSQAEVGAYILLLCVQWSRGFIPSDAGKLRRVAGGSVSLDVLAKFPVGHDGERRNLRMEKVRHDRDGFVARQSQKGLASARSKLNRTPTEAEPDTQPDVNRTPTETQPDTQPDVNRTPNRNSTLQSPVSSLQSPISCNTHTHTPRASRWPTLAQTKDYASIIGFDESEAELFWHHFESAGWIDKNGQPVMKWQSKLVTWNVSSRARAREAAHLAKPERAPRRPEQNQTQEIINVPNL